MVLAPLSAGFQSLPPLATIKLGHSGADSWVGGLVHVLGPCGSPTNSPVRLRVSPAAASTATGVFNQRFEALFPHAGALGCAVCFTPPPFLPVYAWMRVRGLLAVALPAPFHNPPARWVLCPPAAALSQVLFTPAVCLCPSYPSGWMFLLYLLGCPTCMQFDFLSVLVAFCF